MASNSSEIPAKIGRRLSSLGNFLYTLAVWLQRFLSTLISYYITCPRVKVRAVI